ncbi:Sof1-like domain-containing protein [Cryptosporidium serpentis]
MKIKVLQRDPAIYEGNRRDSIRRLFHNPDPRLHPFERAREYTRALTSVKLRKMFAKPLVSVLEGHTDTVQCIARAHHNVSDIYSGSFDGSIRYWNLGSQDKCEYMIRAHEGALRGICVTSNDKYIFSCGDDKKLQMWKIEKRENVKLMDINCLTDRGNDQDNSNGYDNLENFRKQIISENIFYSPCQLYSVDHHWNKSILISSGIGGVQVWDHNRNTPIQIFDWGSDTVYTAKINPSEPYIVATTASDNSIGLFDIRSSTPLRKLIMNNKGNAICWNPQQPLNFTVANDNSMLYTFDMRRLNSARFIYKGFVQAVLDIDYSPIGNSFVAGSRDNTIRIFNIDQGFSRDVYHTKRMQHVWSTKYTADAKFIVSGSSDFCIRLWKNDASQSLGPRVYRERQTLAYRNKLIEKYQHLPEIKRIARYHHIPKVIKSIQEKKLTQINAQKKREENVRIHSKNKLKPTPERQKPVKVILE